MPADAPPPRPDSVRARRSLVAAGVAIAATQLATGLVLDAAPMRVRFPQGAKVIARARALGPAPYVLLLGSSRFWGIDVDAAAATLREAGRADVPVVKGAVPAGDAVVADYLLARLLAGGSRPALVALEVSPETLARPSPWVSDHTIRLFTWRDVAAWLPEILAGDRTTRALAARFAPIGLYRRELLTWLAGRAPPYLRVPRHETPPDGAAAPGPSEGVSARATKVGRDLRGRTPEPDDAAEPPAPPHPSAATLSGIRQTRKWLRHYRADGGAAEALERAVARCRDAGVRVVLVGVPVSSGVRALYTPAIERAFGDVVERARRLGAGFADCRATVPDPFFKDHHHLNVRGGVVFARRLAAEVLAPRLERSRDAAD